MKRISGNNFVLMIMIAVVITAIFFAWKAIEDKRSEKLRESPAYSVLETSEGESPYTDLDGNQIVLTDYFGEVLVVISWASWCPVCATDLPLLSSLAASYEDREVRFLAINRSEPATTAERYLQTISASTGILLVLDPDDRFYKSIEGYAMPETVIYDTEGNIVHHSRGSMKSEEIQLYIDKALEKEGG